MADLHSFIAFQDGCGSNLRKWSCTSNCMLFCTRHVFFSLYTQFHHNRVITDYRNALIFEMAAAIFENGATLPVLCLMNSVFFSRYVYQISSHSGHNKPSASTALIFKMVAAAILENGATLLVLLFRTQHVLFSLSIKFHRNRVMNVWLTHFNLFFPA
jgi:hypothetical protein